MDKTMMLEALINHYTDGNQAKFAKVLGIPAQNISAWLKRKTYNAELIYEKFPDVSAAWLLSGEGDMFCNQQNAETRKSENEILELCKQLVANYQQRDDVMNKLVSIINTK